MISTSFGWDARLCFRHTTALSLACMSEKTGKYEIDR